MSVLQFFAASRSGTAASVDKFRRASKVACAVLRWHGCVRRDVAVAFHATLLRMARYLMEFQKATTLRPHSTRPMPHSTALRFTPCALHPTQFLHSRLYILHLTLHTLCYPFCAPHSAHYAWPVYTPDSTVYTLHSTFSIPSCMPHALHSTRYIPCAALSILHCASAPRFSFRALHCTPDTLRSTPYTVHSAFCGIVCMFHLLCPKHVRQ